MFLQRATSRLIMTNTVLNVNKLRSLDIALGKSETELIDKWKLKFANEKISEIDTSLKHILHHVIQQKVNNFWMNFLHEII